MICIAWWMHVVLQRAFLRVPHDQGHLDDGRAAVTASTQLAGGLGLTVFDDERGPIIADVLDGSAADEAGLRPGDRLLMVNQTKVASTASVTRRQPSSCSGAYSPGTSVRPSRSVRTPPTM